MIEENGYYYERCGDCGQAVKERKMSKLSRVCDECWERRAWLVSNIGLMSSSLERFQKVQRAMAHHTGTAKRYIVKWQNEVVGG